MKYTKKDVLEQRISFKPMSKEQSKKLCKHFNSNLTPREDDYIRFYKDLEYLNNLEGVSTISYLNNYRSVRSNKEISFEEFDFEEEFILPEKWWLKVTKDNLKILNEYLKENPHKYTHYKDSWEVTYYEGERSIYFYSEGTSSHSSYEIKIGFEEITTEQFLEHVVNKNKMKFKIGDRVTLKKGAFLYNEDYMYYYTIYSNQPHRVIEELKDNFIRLKGDCDVYVKEEGLELEESNKEIIGYKLIKPEYKEAAVEIGKKGNLQTFSNIYSINGYIPVFGWRDTIKNLKEAGVLDIWFEPVYEPLYKIGDWVITKGYSSKYDGKPLKITNISEVSGDTFYYFENPNNENHNFEFEDISRRATKEEIEEATKKSKVFTLKCDSGTFELEVSKDGIYYRPENVFLNTDSLEWVTLDRTIKSSTTKEYRFAGYITKVDLGCKKNIPVKDVKAVINYYNSIK